MQKRRRYQTCKTECVPECIEKTVCVTKRVPVMKEECRKVCKKETVWEERTVNKTSYRHVQETCMKKSLVRLGHWECKAKLPRPCSAVSRGGGRVQRPRLWFELRHLAGV